MEQPLQQPDINMTSCTDDLRKAAEILWAWIAAHGKKDGEAILINEAATLVENTSIRLGGGSGTLGVMRLALWRAQTTGRKEVNIAILESNHRRIAGVFQKTARTIRDQARWVVFKKQTHHLLVLEDRNILISFIGINAQNPKEMQGIIFDFCHIGSEVEGDVIDEMWSRTYNRSKNNADAISLFE